MLYVNTSILPAVFLDSLTRLESLLFAVLALDGRHTNSSLIFRGTKNVSVLNRFIAFCFYRSSYLQHNTPEPSYRI